MATETATAEATRQVRAQTTPGPAAYERRIGAQILEADARIEKLERRVRDNRLQEEVAAIDRLRVARDRLQTKLQNLATTAPANIVRAKADIDGAAAALRAGLDDLARALAAFTSKR